MSPLSSVFNPKVVLVGCLPESSKMDLFINYSKCTSHREQHRLGQQPAIGIQLNTLPFLHKGRKIELDIWNVTIPFERYRQLAPIYCDNVQAIVGVCSLSNVQSFYRMQYWLNKFREQNHSNMLLNVYILACDSDDQSTFYSLHSGFGADPRSIIMDYGCHIQARVFLIRNRTKGRDLQKFFDDFLNRFWVYGRQQSKLEIFWQQFARGLICNCFC